MSMFFVVAFLLTGVFSGLVAGMLGIGGGMIIVPVVVAILDSQGIGAGNSVKIAVATSLAIIIPTAISSTRAHHKSGMLRWDIFKNMLAGILIGTAVGGLLVDMLPEGALKVIFGTGCFLVAAKMITNAKPKPSRQLPKALGLNLMGGFNGALSTMLGIGGGTITVPFLVWCNVNMRQAVATSAACGLPISLGGALTLALAGSDPSLNLPAGNWGYIFLPAWLFISISAIIFAPIGAKLSQHLPVLWLKMLIGFFLIASGSKMLWSVWHAAGV